MKDWLKPIHLANAKGQQQWFWFPYAGGGPAVFNSFKPHIPASVDVYSAYLPGREGRFNEPPETDLSAIIQACTAAISAVASRQIVIFGHSLGALIGYLVAARLETSGITVNRLLVSGRHGPGVKAKTNAISHLADKEFLQAMSSYGGMSEEILQCPEILELMLPSLKADFSLSECYDPIQQHPKIRSEMIVAGAVDDDLVDFSKLQNWKNFTTGPFRLVDFHGGHFYLASQAARLVQLMDLGQTKS
jgi:medium-chain acyl-[acyl-carrier-protein] hydrolase